MNRFPQTVRERLADPTFRSEIRRAEVVLGVNVLDPADRRVFYGTRALAGVGEDSSLLLAVEVPVDYAPPSEDAEALAAYVLMSRGSCSYPAAEVREDWN